MHIECLRKVWLILLSTFPKHFALYKAYMILSHLNLLTFSE